MFNDDRIVNLPGLTLMLLAGLVASAVWSSIGPPLYGVLAALVQTGVTTRLVLLCLFFSCGVALFALRTLKQVWYGRIACVGALAACWQLLGSLAVQMQPVDVLALVGAGYILVRGLVNIGPGSDGGTGSDRGQTGVRPGSDRGQTPRILI